MKQIQKFYQTFTQISSLLLILTINIAHSQTHKSARWSEQAIPHGFNNYFLAVKQCNDGFYWLGGTDGLWRFDGTNFSQIAFEIKNASENTPTILTIAQDQHNRIWLGTTDGVYLYQADINKARRVAAGGGTPVKKLIYFDNKIYGLSYRHGAFVIDASKQDIEQFKRIDLMPTHRLTHDLVISDQRIWLLNKDMQLRIFDREQHKMQQSIDLSQYDYQKLVLLEQHLWLVQGDSKLGALHRRDLTFTPYTAKLPSSIKQIQTVIAMDKQQLQLFDQSNQRWLFDETSQQLTSLGIIYDDKNRPLNISIRQAIIDLHHNITLIGREPNQLYRQNQAISLKLMNSVKFGPNNPVKNISFNHQGQAFVATEQGLYRYHDTTLVINMPIKQLIPSGNGEIWFLNQNNQLIHYQTKQNQLTRFASKTCQQWIKQPLFIDKTPTDQWIVFEKQQGLILIDQQQCRKDWIKFEVPRTQDGFGLFAVSRYSQDMWIFSSKWGVWELDWHNNKVEPWIMNFRSHRGIKPVFSISQQHQSLLIPEHGGYLYNFNIATQKIIRLENQLFNGDFVVKAHHLSQQQTNKRIAIIGKQGIYIYYPDSQTTLWWSLAELLTEPQLKQQHVVFYQDTLLISQGNQVWSLDINQLPAQIIPKPYVRELQINHQNQQSHPEHRYLNQEISQIKQLTIDHQVLHLGLEISAKHYANFPIGFEYRLIGLNPQWVTLDNNRIAHFTRLNAGKYRFEVRTTNQLGQKSKHITALDIKVEPAPWASTKAKLLYLLCLLTFTFGFVWRQQRTIRKRQQILERKVAKRTANLNAALQDLATKSHEVSELLKDKEALIQQKDTMLAAISHELKTPLTTLMVPIQQLLDQPNMRTRDKKLLRMMQRSSNCIRTNVDQILQLAKLSDYQKLNKQQLPLSQLVSYVCNNYRDFATSFEISIEVQIEPQLHITGDLQGLELLLSNLLSNAIQYSGTGQTVYVTLQLTQQKEQPNAKIQVIDQGIGMSPLTQARIFNPFDQGEQQHANGSGLGMAIVKAVVDAHHGEIAITSQPNQGTSITVLLPKVNTLATTDSQAIVTQSLTSTTQVPIIDNDTSIKPQKQKTDSNLPCILIVDDQPEIITLLSIVLSSHYQLIFASSGAKALDQLNHHPVELILCDHHMPQMEGSDFTRICKQRPSTSHIPIIIMSADSQNQVQQQALDSMADTFIAKPFDYQLLCKQIDSLLANRKLISAKELQQIDVSDQAQALSSTVIQAELSVNDHHFLGRLAQLLAEHYADSEFKINDHLNRFNMSERNFRYKIKALTGESPTSYLYQYRIEKAKQQLSSELSLEQIAQQNGFKNQRHFRTRFNEFVGMTPAQMRNQITSPPHQN